LRRRGTARATRTTRHTHTDAHAHTHTHTHTHTQTHTHTHRALGGHKDDAGLVARRQEVRHALELDLQVVLRDGPLHVFVCVYECACACVSRVARGFMLTYIRVAV
jgi:hypothetical protein